MVAQTEWYYLRMVLLWIQIGRDKNQRSCGFSCSSNLLIQRLRNPGNISLTILLSRWGIADLFLQRTKKVLHLGEIYGNITQLFETSVWNQSPLIFFPSTTWITSLSTPNCRRTVREQKPTNESIRLEFHRTHISIHCIHIKYFTSHITDLFRQSLKTHL